jgi:hypothetical protein
MVEKEASAERLRFKDNDTFLRSTPGVFRVFATNFGYVTEENLPFFFDTPTKGLYALNKGYVTQPGLSKTKVMTVAFQTFHHPLVRELQRRLHVYGPTGLMNRLTEALPLSDNRYLSNYYYNYYGNLYLGYHIAGDKQAFGTAQRMFEGEFQPGTKSVARPYPLPTIEFAYGSSFGVYNWELFFHLPMLIAGRLTQDLKFEDALRWYHYVFDPKQTLNLYEQSKCWAQDLIPGSRYWNFLPFFANQDTTDSLSKTLGLSESFNDYDRAQLRSVIDDWRRNPFKPHLVARQRMSAYQKFVFMKYLDNLIAWADSLFRQDTFETINMATQLYVLADEMLGDRPQSIEPPDEPQSLTYNELQAMGVDAFSNATSEVEYHIVSNPEYLTEASLDQQASSMAPLVSLVLRSFFFQIPRNERLDRYWDTVGDRLFKIRNSMNIDGVKRQLALFEPPIDPSLLVRAANAGLDLGSVMSQLNTPIPNYRFSVWMQKAVDLCNELKGFGSAFLSALEKKDAESLQLLRQSHEIKMLNLARKVRKKQVEEAEGNIRALELSRVMAEERHDEYQRREKISQDEKTQVAKTNQAKNLETLQGALHSLAAIFAAIPDAQTGPVGPFPMGTIVAKIGSALVYGANANAAALGAAASFIRGEATLAGLTASFERRWEDWKLQERLATEEMRQMDQQIAVANIRLSIAEQELENHETQIEHAQEVQEFLKDKFTNRELYSFMVTELSRTYQQVYKLAYDAAKTAERAFQFELGVEETFIDFGYLKSLHQGLLAGEKLIHDLKRMEVGYLERNKREYEVQKPISLAVLNGRALQDLRDTGRCTFELPEILFDLDFPGQYFRRIKSVRLTIPCVTGPHTSVSAKLTLLGSVFRKDASVAGTDYARTEQDDPRFVQNPVGIQAIATSSAQGDAGLFELNFRDERYLPFEGAGAISRWQLELPTAAPQFDYQTISDVFMQLSYTAREGGESLKSAAEAEIVHGLNNILKILYGENENSGLVRAFSLRREFPDLFHQLLADSGSVKLKLALEHFPFLIRNQQMTMAMVNTGSVQIRIDLKPGTATTDLTLDLNGTSRELTAVDEAITPAVSWQGDTQSKTLPQEFTLQRPSSTPLTLDSVEDIVLTVTYTVALPQTP